MHITTEAPIGVETEKQFRAEPSWQDKIMHQITEVTIDDASEVTLDLLYYILDRMVHTRPSERCIVTLDDFQAYEQSHGGASPVECREAWSTLDWRHAFESPCE